jgi:hypothetical protein
MAGCWGRRVAKRLSTAGPHPQPFSQREKGEEEMDGVRAVGPLPNPLPEGEGEKEIDGLRLVGSHLLSPRGEGETSCVGE